MSNFDSYHNTPPHAAQSGPLGVSFGRRLGALLYDAIAAFTVLYFASFVPVLASGDALTAGNPLYSAYLLVVLFGYFWSGWSRGRTLGMQAWKIEIETLDGRRPGWRAAALRFVTALLAAAPCALGYLAALGDRERRAWHDRLSATRLVAARASGRDNS